MRDNLTADVANWHPRLTCVWTKQQITQWIDINGRWSFYNGRRFTIVAKKIFGNRYEVSFKDYDQ